jgi:hypothetical protein
MWVTVLLNEAKDDIMVKIYNLYVMTYNRRIGALVFTDRNQFKNTYTCVTYYIETESDIESIKCFIFIIEKSFSNHLSLIGDDQTPLGKQLLFDHVASLLVTPGYYYETLAGSVSSRVLRFQYRLMPILRSDVIARLLELDKGRDDIRMKSSFNFSDPNDFVYIKYVMCRNDGTCQYSIRSVMFGMGCSEGFVQMEMTGSGCNRKCLYSGTPFK